jgi:hypothetical protein
MIRAQFINREEAAGLVKELCPNLTVEGPIRCQVPGVGAET